jgi:hypothetical protein
MISNMFKTSQIVTEKQYIKYSTCKYMKYGTVHENQYGTWKYMKYMKSNT